HPKVAEVPDEARMSLEAELVRFGLKGQTEARPVEAARVADAALPLADLVRIDGAIRLTEFCREFMEPHGEVVLRPPVTEPSHPQLGIAEFARHRSQAAHCMSQFIARAGTRGPIRPPSPGSES